MLISQDVTLNYVVTNHGPDSAPFALTIQLPPGGRAATWNPLGGGWSTPFDCSDTLGNPVVCSGVLASGQSARFSLDEMANAPGVLSADATVSSSATTDPDPGNNTVDCQVTGTPGDDVLTAGPGQAACGLGGNDILCAQQGSIGLNNPPGDANALAIGGDGIDTASFANALNPIVVCPSDAGGFWSGAKGSPDLGDAEMGGIENIVGSPYDDYLVGNPGANTIQGGGGNDEITGGGGHDILDGNVGSDRFMGADRTHDSLSGGPGADHADVDHNDLTSSTTTQSVPTFLSPCA